jgi:O-antigen/teichoic acid export membrane protein
MINVKELLNSSYVRKMFKSFSIYTGANFINLAAPFFLLPILTRVLSPSDYGILATFMAMMGIVNIIAMAGSTDALIRGYFDREKQDFNFAKFAFNALMVNVMVFLVLIFIILLFKSFISVSLSVPANWLFLLPVIGLCGAIYAPACKLFLFKKQPVPYVILKTSYTFGELSLSILLVVFLSLNWQGRVIGIAINNILFCLAGVYILWKSNYLNVSYNTKYIKQILIFGLPVLVHSLGFPIIAAVDKIFLNRMIGLSATGVYSVGYAIAAVIGILSGAFNAVWSPFLYERLGHATNALKKKLVKLTYAYFMIISFITFALIMSAPYFLKFFVGKEFLGASQFIFWIAMGYAAHAMYTIVSGYIFYQKKTYLLTITAFITVVLSVIFNYILIRLNGAIGAAQAAFLVFLSRFLLVWYFSNKAYPMPWFSFAKVK